MSADAVDVRVLWDDLTPHGVSISGRLQATVHNTLYPRTSATLADEMGKPPTHRRRLSAALAAGLVREDRRRLRHKRLIEDPLFWEAPVDLVVPQTLLLLVEGGDHAMFPADEANFALARRLLAGEGPAPFGIDRILARAQAALDDSGWVRIRRTSPERLGMVGHACVTLSDGVTRLWADPFLRPKSPRYDPAFQPGHPADSLEQHHAILITHGHPDHFDPGSLLRFPADTPIYVPRHRGHTPLSLDLAALAGQLGMTNVHELDWGEGVAINGYHITAMPFHGEQPLGPGAAPLHEGRMRGNIYHIADATGFTTLLMADSGSDWSGRIEDWGRMLRSRFGAIDMILANHRSWRLHPPQYLTTSVPQYLCYVPDAELDRVQRIMLDPGDLGQLAAILGARRVVPYAMGGAPWFAELGLGAETGNHVVGAFDSVAQDVLATSDPDVLIAADGRTLILHPGDSIDAALEIVQPAVVPALARPRCSTQGAWIGHAIANLEPAAVAALLATDLPGRAIVIATPGYVEIVAPIADEATPQILAPSGGWALRSDPPLTLGLFAAAPAWADAFVDVHRGLLAVLREGGDVALAARAALASAPLAAVRPEALRAVASSLIGIAPSRIRQAAGELPGALTDHAIALPPDAAPLIAIHGEAMIGAALLAIKLLHNMYLTAAAAGSLLAGSEAAWLENALAPQ